MPDDSSDCCNTFYDNNIYTSIAAGGVGGFGYWGILTFLCNSVSPLTTPLACSIGTAVACCSTTGLCYGGTRLAKYLCCNPTSNESETTRLVRDTSLARSKYGIFYSQSRAQFEQNYETLPSAPPIKTIQTTKTPDEFICPITQEIMRDPVITKFGHSFERTAIERWINERSTCPLTRQPLGTGDLLPNPELYYAIRTYLQSNPNLQTEEKASTSTFHNRANIR